MRTLSYRPEVDDDLVAAVRRPFRMSLMTEETWEAWTDPEDFLKALAHTTKCRQDPVPQWLQSIASRLTNRKLRLFAVACCRRLEHPDFAPLILAAADLAEIRIGSNADRKRLNSANRRLRENVLRLDLQHAAILCALTGSSAVRAAASTAWHCCRRESPGGGDFHGEERIAQGRLLRDVIGNPFRRVAFPEKLQTMKSVTLASAMYESQCFDDMPMLADALDEAGCDDLTVLAHCRDREGVHVRGCWVVDLVLGKA